MHKSLAPRPKKRPRMETTPESRPPRQNIRLHARIDHFHARIKAPTPEFESPRRRPTPEFGTPKCLARRLWQGMPHARIYRSRAKAISASGCMSPAIMLHRASIWACNDPAWGLQLCCTGRIWLHGSCNYATQVQHMAATGVHLGCTGAA